MHALPLLAAGLTALASTTAAPAQEPLLAAGPWRAALASPGGELPFGLLVLPDGGVQIVNGEERIPIPEVRREGDAVVLALPHYDSRLVATPDGTGDVLRGTWRKRASGKESWTEMTFVATRGAAPRFAPLPDPSAGGAGVDGRWRVAFESSDEPAVGVFETAPDGTLAGTVLTTTGDYRYLAGSFEAGRLRLSTFDGAHAFLFDARLRGDGTLAGDFWSRDSWHETWTAVRDEEARLPDPYAETSWTPGTGLAELAFPDPGGEVHSVAELAFGSRATILQVFGSWCPNCHDESAFLAELFRRRRAEGLQVIGLAFELTGDFERDAEQVRRFAEKYEIEFPLLVAGLADKALATAALGALDRVRSFPTAIFLDGRGEVRAVHTGFTGPATGTEYEEVVRDFEARVTELVSEEPDDAETWAWLSAPGTRWGDGLVFREVRGERRLVARDRSESVELWGDALRLDGELCGLDRRARALIDPRRFGERVFRRADGDESRRPPLLVELGLDDAAALAHADPVVRREGVLSRATAAALAGEPFPELASLIQDADLGVRVAAAWAAGRVGASERIEDLLRCLEHPNPALRREATRALARWRAEERVATALAERLGDPHPWVREAAREILQPERTEGSR